MKVDVVYFVESVPKELDVACIVRTLAQQRFGLNIEITSYKDHTPDWLLRTRPRLLVIPTCYAADAWGLRRHIGRWPGTPYLNLTWEQLFCRANFTWKHPRDRFAQKHVQHLIWGDFYREFLTSNGVPPEHITVTGNPGYRLYTSPYSSFFPTRHELAKKHGLDPDKRWIFLPENYGWAFYTEANISGRIQDGMDPSTPALLQEYCRTTLRTVLGWCQECTRSGAVEMIIRPRPTTPLVEFKELSEKLYGGPLEPIRLIKDGTVNEWILASDVVVSSFSTSLLEASIAGKPAYMLEPIPLPDPLWSTWNDEADSLKTQDEFLAACLNPAAIPEQRLRTWAQANLLAQGDPIENLVDYIGRVCNGQATLPPPFDSAPLVARPRNGPVKGLLRASWKGVQQLLTGSPVTQDRAMSFRKEEVERRTKAWNRVLASVSTARR